MYSLNKDNKNKKNIIKTKEDIKVNNIKKTSDNTNKDSEADFRKYVIELIEDAIEELGEDIYFYEQLSKLATTQKDIDILRQIYLDKKKYKDNFENIYKILVGTEPSLDSMYEYDDVSDNFLDELADKIEDELENIELYRTLMSMFSDLFIRDMINEAIIGTQKHVAKLIAMYARNK